MVSRPGAGERWGLGAALVFGGGWRFATLDVQSLARDEAVTLTLVDRSLGAMLERLPDTESTPPLFYILEWLWTRVAGLGEVGLRSLPALFGTLSIVAAWALGRRLGGARGGVAAAVAVAANPFAVWYSQEARAYALLGLLALLACLAWLDALDRRRRARWWWAIAAAAAVATHYFALVLVVPQAAVLVWRLRAIAPALVVAATGLGLAPLAIAQRGTGNLAWLEEEPLLQRLADTPKHLATGPFGTPFDPLAVAIGLLLVAGVALAAVKLSRARRLLVVIAGALMAAIVVLPSYVTDRNLLELALPALAIAGAGLATRSRAAVGALALALAVCSVTIAVDEELQREDVRAAADQITADALVVTSVATEAALRVYRPNLQPTPPTAPATKVTYLSDWRFGRPRPSTPLPPADGWRVTERVDGPTTTVVTIEATPPATPVTLDTAALAARPLDPSLPAAVFAEP